MNRHPDYHRIFLTLSLCALFLFPFIAMAGADNELVQDAQYGNGKHLFMRYCKKCHGKKADGEGRMTKKIYRKKQTQLPANFTLGIFIDRPDDYMRKIITEGGPKNDLSKYMPPFKDEISEKDVEDLIHFIRKTAVLTRTKYQQSIKTK
jgi:mono/diheme cytochrome c family protein